MNGSARQIGSLGRLALSLLFGLVVLSGCPAEDPSSDDDSGTSADADAVSDATDTDTSAAEDTRDTRDTREQYEAGCHTDCFGGMTCEDGVVKRTEYGPKPCYVGEGCVSSVVGTCEGECKESYISEWDIPDESRTNWKVMCNDDSDDDGLLDSEDNCPEIANCDQVDTNENGFGDVCDDTLDSDGDGIADYLDPCPDSAEQADTDADEIPDACDNCPNVANALQDDADGDGTGDLCEEDPCLDATCDSCMAETCNGSDDDCDGAADNGCPTSCTPGPEVCDGQDNDCDGVSDEGCCDGT